MLRLELIPLRAHKERVLRIIERRPGAGLRGCCWGRRITRQETVSAISSFEKIKGRLLEN